MPDTFPPDVEEFVRDELDRGEFRTREDLLTEALRVFKELRAQHDALRIAIRQSIVEADRGEAVEIDIEEVIASGFERSSRQRGTP